MSETLENARRWGGFVCPDCRFVFRVPRDHDGKGVVCPCCKRLLRIPVAGEATQPLSIPVREVTTGETVPETAPQEHRKRHRSKKRSRGSDSPAWEHESHNRHSRRKEKRQMFWMLVGGAALFALIVAGVIAVTYDGGGNSSVAVAPPAVPAPAPVKAAEDGPVPSILRRGEEVFIAEAESLARKFLTAKSVSELLPLVRNPEIAEGRMKRFYPDGVVVPPGLAAFNEGGFVSYKDKLASVILRTANFKSRPLAYVETPDGLKIDWESWVGWSDVSWDEFIAAKSTTPVVFRVTLKLVEYYNFEFKDEGKWQSYSLVSPDGEHSLYGYAERGSELGERLRPDQSGGSATVTVALKYPEGALPGNQVLIDQFISDGWVEGLPDSP